MKGRSKSSLADERAVLLAQYIVETNATVRAAAQKFKISKSTVHKDITQRLKMLNPILCREASRILAENKAQRHIRGGLATKKKFEACRMRKEGEG